jgi:hypothetical protein
LFLDKEAKAFVGLGFADVLCRYVKDAKIFNGGAEGDRTPDLTAASRALSQLSYSPTTEDGD